MGLAEPAKEPEPELQREERGDEGEDEELPGDAEDASDQILPDKENLKADLGQETGPGDEAPVSEEESEGASQKQQEVPAEAPRPAWKRGWQILRHRFQRSKERLTTVALKVARRSSPGCDRGDFLMSDEPSEEYSESHASDDSATDPWLVVNREGAVLAEDGEVSSKSGPASSVEAKIGQVLTWMIAPAVHGIPKLSVPSAADRAAELLAEKGRDLEEAVKEVVAGSERTVSVLVLNFCLERIPILGCPTVLLRTTWGNLRSILIIAALYGHDLDSPRVQHEALLCLVPPGEEKDKATALALQRRETHGGIAQPLLEGETAQNVARMMIRGALRRATGLEAAVDCFELASLLYSSCGNEEADEDGFVHVMATPASAARDFFRRRSKASRAILWCSLPLLALGSSAPGLLAVIRSALTAFSTLRLTLQRMPRSLLQAIPAALLAILGLALAYRMAVRLDLASQAPRRPAGLEEIFQRFLTRARRGSRTQFLSQAWPQGVTTAVFAAHALLPAISTFSALSVILESASRCDGTMAVDCGQGWDLLHRIACAVLGIYSLCCVGLYQLQSEVSVEVADKKQIGKALRLLVQGVLKARAVSRGACFIAAWVYIWVVLDLGIGWFGGWFWNLTREEALLYTPLGVLPSLGHLLGAPDTTSPLGSDKATQFVLNVISVASQQRLVELLGRREVLLRLIGAERVTASTICLLLKGVAVACNNAKNGLNPVAEFISRVAPPAPLCVAIIAVRAQALAFGAAMVLAPRLIASGVLGSSAAFLIGICAGGYICRALLRVWYTHQEELESSAGRIALLVPGNVSGRAKGLLRGTLAGAGTRAVQMMAMGILDRAVKWWWRYIQ